MDCDPAHYVYAVEFITKFYDLTPDSDIPNPGVRRASTHNDIQRRVPEIDTFAATLSRRGTPTTFTVDNLPDDATIALEVDDRRCDTWRRSDPGVVAIELDIDTHRIRLTYS